MECTRKVIEFKKIPDGMTNKVNRYFLKIEVENVEMDG
jgi:hypothetical protein